MKKNIDPERIYIVNLRDPIIGNKYSFHLGRRIILNNWEDKVVGKSFKTSDQAWVEIVGLEARDNALRLSHMSNKGWQR